MKRHFTRSMMAALLLMAVALQAQDSLFISELSDPADDYSGRFIELYNAGSMAVDFSAYTFYLSRQSNGGTSWGDVQLTGSVPAGGTYVIGGSAFASLYGFAPDLETGILIGNGDDAYGLFRDGDHSTGVLHDLFGVIDVDGTGEPWEYTDSRALRKDSILVPNGIWTASEWEITPADLADGDPGTHLGSDGPEPPDPSGDFALAVDDAAVDLGQPLLLPVRVSELSTEDHIIAYQFRITYDTALLEYTGISLLGTIAEGGTVLANVAPAGSLSVSYMNTVPISGSGALGILQFHPLAVDTTAVLISGAYLNNLPVEDLSEGTVIITESAPPTAAITYSDSLNRFADTLVITATFSEAMNASVPVHLNLSGAASLADAAMTRVCDTVYRYLYRIPATGGMVTVRLGNGTDLFGNVVVAEPVSGESFGILPFRPGDVNDDGMILAYDAALTLQHSVGIDPLPDTDPLPWEAWRDSTANVDASEGITANDAALILQYSVGIISAFPSEDLISAPLASMSVEIEQDHLVFYSEGPLLGFNLDVVSGSSFLGRPEILDESFLSAIHIGSGVYRVGLCTAVPAEEGSAVMRIPCKGTGPLVLDMTVNTDKNQLLMDLQTGREETDAGTLSLYPNPAGEILYIYGLLAAARVMVLNLHGQVQMIVQLDAPGGGIPLAGLPEGQYFLRLETDRGQIVKRFIRQ